MIADNHLDDRVIEIIKIMYIDQMKKEMEDDTLLNILFDYNRDNYCFLVFSRKRNREDSADKRVLPSGGGQVQRCN